MEAEHKPLMAHVQSLPHVSQAHDVGDDYDVPPPEPSASFAGLKDRIKRHYEIGSDYYYSLWYVPAERSLYRNPGLEGFAKKQG